MLEQLFTQVAGQILTSPAFWQLLEQSCHHTRHDLAQDALDALEAGHITREEAMRIINILLSDQGGAGSRPSPSRPTRPAPLPTTYPVDPVRLLLEQLRLS